MNAKEVLVGHLPRLDLHDPLVQRQQITAYGGGKGAESGPGAPDAPNRYRGAVLLDEGETPPGGRSQSPAPTTARAFASAMRSWSVRTR